jgi:phosphoglycolate phosphatase
VNLVIFDLDGTLIDSRLDLAHSVNATRAHAGLGPIDPEVVYSYVGNGAPALIRRALPGADEAEIAHALGYFIEYYRDHALDNTALYPGVRESLIRMHENGAKLAVLTNKPVRISLRILHGLGISGLFFQVYGGNSFEFKKPHPVGIETLRGEANAAAGFPVSTWMVGDSAVDVQTARNAGVPSCGVLWGFQPETLREYPPDLLIGSMKELEDRLMKRQS